LLTRSSSPAPENASRKLFNMLNISTFTSHKTAILIVLGVVLVAVPSFLAGRHFAPVDVRTVETTKTIETRHELQTIVQKVDIEELKKAISQIQIKNNVVTQRVIEYHADGTKEVKETVVNKTETDKKTDTSSEKKTDDQATTNTNVTDNKQVETSKMVEQLRKPNWGLAAQVGLNLLHPIDGIGNVIPGVPKPMVLRLVLERRLFGGLYGQAWTDSHLDAGVGLRLGW